MGYRKPLRHSVAHFDTLASLLAASLDTGQRWELFDASGDLWQSGVMSSAGLLPHPVRGAHVAFTEVAENSTYGYQVLSGSVSAVIADSGGASAGYLEGETVTAATGVLGIGGSAATWTVTVVGGDVTAITPVLIGDYEQVPTGANTVTGGSGTGLILTLAQDVTGVTESAAGLVVHVKKSVDTAGRALIRLPVVAGSAGWWLPSRVELGFEYTLNTQHTAADGAPATATRIGLRAYRTGDLRSTSVEAGIYADEPASYQHYVYTAPSATTTVAGAITDPSSADNIALVVHYVPDGANLQVSCATLDLDSTTGRAPLAATPGVVTYTDGDTNWTLTAADSATTDPVFFDVLIYPGPTANDECTVTLTYIEAS